VRNSRNSKKHPDAERLLKVHKLHLGLYARVAEDLGVSPSYVSLVANGMRRSERIRRVLVQEIAKVHASLR
jgi:transcriptional regulator with XRE-family HTH domain